MKSLPHTTTLKKHLLPARAPMPKYDPPPPVDPDKGWSGVVKNLKEKFGPVFGPVVAKIGAGIITGIALVGEYFWQTRGPEAERTPSRVETPAPTQTETPTRFPNLSNGSTELQKPPLGFIEETPLAPRIDAMPTETPTPTREPNKTPTPTVPSTPAKETPAVPKTAGPDFVSPYKLTSDGPKPTTPTQYTGPDFQSPYKLGPEGPKPTTPQPTQKPVKK